MQKHPATFYIQFEAEQATHTHNRIPHKHPAAPHTHGCSNGHICMATLIPMGARLSGELRAVPARFQHLAEGAHQLKAAVCDVSTSGGSQELPRGLCCHPDGICHQEVLSYSGCTQALPLTAVEQSGSEGVKRLMPKSWAAVFYFCFPPVESSSLESFLSH